ncbi:MAG: hypothetical protein ACREM1_18495 [Longimicrobiales bacterium]
MRGRRGSTSLHDSESSGTIYDYAAGTFTVINHEDRTYFTTSFADMAQALEAQAAEARERIHEARAEAGDATDSVEQSDIVIDVKVSVDQRGTARRSPATRPNGSSSPSSSAKRRARA